MRGRKKILRKIRFFPEITYFKPAGVPLRNLEEVILNLDELEAMRLAELDDLDQEKSAEKMEISRITFQRILHSAHKKIAESLIYGKAIRMGGGEVIMPNLDQTGPQGQGPMTGRGRGQGWGPKKGQGLGGSEECICSKCAEKVTHRRGIPCSETLCPKCQTPMTGKFCK